MRARRTQTQNKKKNKQIKKVTQNEQIRTNYLSVKIAYISGWLLNVYVSGMYVCCVLIAFYVRIYGENQADNRPSTQKCVHTYISTPKKY